MQSALFGAPTGQRLMGVSDMVTRIFRREQFAAPRVPVRTIEIVGLAGSGKSTLLAELRRRRPTPAFWATKDEIFTARGQPRISQCDVESIDIDVLKSKLERIFASARTNSQLHRNYYNSFLHYFDFVFLSSMKAPCHVVCDEGFFYTFRTEILRQCAQTPALFGTLARRQAFVAIRCDPAQSVANIRARAARGGKVLAGHQGLDDATLLRHAEEDMHAIEALLGLARGADVPVLEIESRSDLDAAAARFAALFR